MDVFKIHRDVISDYADYTQSFIKIADRRISERVHNGIEDGLLWPEPLLQLNPSFEPGRSIEELVGAEILHQDCGQIFRIKSSEDQFGKTLRLHKHQDQAIETYLRAEPYVLTTGTGSGKSLSCIIPAVDHVLIGAYPEHLQPAIESLSVERAKLLADAHSKVRKSAKQSGRVQCGPVDNADVLGCFILLPNNG